MSSINSGSVTIFRQTSAQPGWTKLTTVNDYMLRIVNGANNTVAAQAFSTVFSSQGITGNITVSGTVSATTISTPQMAPHNHPDAITATLNSPTRFPNVTTPTFGVINASTASLNLSGTGPAGGGSSHTHPLTNSTAPITTSTLNFNVRYVDVILARRNY